MLNAADGEHVEALVELLDELVATERQAEALRARLELHLRVAAVAGEMARPASVATIQTGPVPLPDRRAGRSYAKRTKVLTCACGASYTAKSTLATRCPTCRRNRTKDQQRDWQRKQVSTWPESSPSSSSAS